MDGLAERIMLDLKNAFKKDPLIDEFDILPVEESQSNKSPVLHVDHKLALEKWCVKHVYVCAYSKFFTWKKRKNCGEIVDPESLLTWTYVILLINPKLETAWNARKEMIVEKSLLPCQELKFTEVVLSWKPKCSEVYAQRQWVLQKCIASVPLEQEFSLCSKWAGLYPSNYYAWSHRLWMLQNKESKSNNKQQNIQDELIRTESWVSVNLSDHCGFHYRQQLLSALQPATAVLKNEVDFCTDLQKSYPGHEALWNHRRFLLWALNNQHATSHPERKSIDSIAKKSPECNQVPCHSSDKVQIGLNNRTYSHLRYEVESSNENGHVPLDCSRVFNVHHSEISQRTANFKCENDSLDKNCPIETLGPLYCNGDAAMMEREPKAEELPLGFVGHNYDEKVLKQEIEFVQERQISASHLPWENLLLQKHVKWVSSVLGWSLLLSR